MNGYLGETPLDVSTHPEYSTYTATDWAMLYISRYGQIDGGHHKTWVLDQVAQILRGTPVIVVTARWDNGGSEDRFSLGEPSAEYLEWRKEMQGEYNEEFACYEYGYDEGIAP